MAEPGTGRDLHAQLIEEVLRSMTSPEPTDDDLLKVHAVLGNILVAALNLADNGEVVKVCSPHNRHFYQVTGSAGNLYTVHSYELTKGNAYCSCNSFVYSCLLSPKQLLCKHILAVKLAERLERCKTVNIARENLPGLLNIG